MGWESRKTEVAMVSKTLGVFLAFLFVSGVVGQDGWSVTYTPERICASKGSTVDMPCIYTYPKGHRVKTTVWFINKLQKKGEPKDLSKNPQYRGRVQYLGNKDHDCSVRITGLTESDSATYRFRFLTNSEGGKYTGEPGVTLTVTALQVSVNPDIVTEEQNVTFTCRTTCTLSKTPAFIWYRNNKGLSFTSQEHQITASSGDAGSYSCAVRGYENLHSPAVTLSVEYPPKNTSVSVSPSGEIEEGSSVTLTCSSDANPPVHRYTWFKKTGDRRFQKGTGESYTLTNISSEDSGQYYCEAQNQHGALNSTAVTIDVQYAPKNTSVSVSPSGEKEEGSSVTLNCSSDANPPVHRYTWFKKNESGVWQTGSGQTLNFTNLRSWNSGQYYCETENKHGAHNSTAALIITQGNLVWIIGAIVGIAAIVALVFPAVIAWKRRRNSVKEAESREEDKEDNKSPVYGNISEMALGHSATQDTNRDDDVQPANTSTQEETLYSNVKKLNGQIEVQYTSIRFSKPSAAPRPLAPKVEDDCVLYSTVAKHKT